jgi:hypothetical protein
MKTEKALFGTLIVGILFVVLICGCTQNEVKNHDAPQTTTEATLSVAEGKAPEVHQTTNDATPSDAGEHFSAYYDQELGIKIEYPMDWPRTTSIGSGKNIGDIHLIGGNETNKEFIEIYVEVNDLSAEPKTLEEYTNQRLSWM